MQDWRRRWHHVQVGKPTQRVFLSLQASHASPVRELVPGGGSSSPDEAMPLVDLVRFDARSSVIVKYRSVEQAAKLVWMMERETKGGDEIIGDEPRHLWAVLSRSGLDQPRTPDPATRVFDRV